MSPDRWRRIDEIFQQAADLAAPDRDAFLVRECGSDLELRHEVESLLGYDGTPPSHLDDVIRTAAAKVADEHSSSVAGQRIGPYELIRPIGKGGMGSVYLAVRADDTFRKQVALKVVKRGMDTDFVLSRFRHERQILAALEHPNIARLLDGGATNDGLPFFVMEYVEGQPITTYCREQKAPLAERIQMFRHVCSAVTAAHQNLVVHRDIKPGNILVTKEGVPKLLDFGIAKMLHGDISTTSITQTMTGMRMLTPDYASPEQIRGEAITTATDVYSLGVLLFELLTGRAPYAFPSGSILEVQRVICETEPPPPSSVGGELRRQLQGDLDNIVLMAMRKEPARRYVSVNQLSEDLRRYEEGLPVVARKDTVLYRTSKFIRRHRVTVLAGALLFLSLVGGIAATTYQARVAARRFGQVRMLANSFLFEFHDSIANVPGATKARELVVRKGLEYLDALAAEASGDPILQEELAGAYQKVGDVQGNPVGGNLGDSAGALSSYRRAMTILEQIKPRTNSVRKMLADTYHKIGAVQGETGATAEALESYRKAERLAEELLASNPSHATLRTLAGIYDASSRTMGALGDIEGSLIATNRAILILNRLVQASPNDDELQQDLSSFQGTLAIQLPRVGRLEEGLKAARQAAAMREELVRKHPNDLRFLRNLMIAWAHVGDNLALPSRPSMGDYKGALEAYQRVHEIALSLSSKDANDRRLQVDLSLSLQRLATAQYGLGQRAEALKNLRKAQAIQEQVIARDPSNAMTVRNLAFVFERIGEIEEANGNNIPALSALKRAVEISETMLAKDPENQNVRQQLLGAARTYALLQAKAGNRQVALLYGSQLMEMAEELARKGAADWTRAAAPALTAAALGDIETVLGRTVEARRWYSRSAQEFQKLKAAGRLDPYYEPEVARVAALVK
jgi:serine/threonine protein kinase/tetratricopeptide (TPR) repeat protein